MHILIAHHPEFRDYLPHLFIVNNYDSRSSQVREQDFASLQCYILFKI